MKKFNETVAALSVTSLNSACDLISDLKLYDIPKDDFEKNGLSPYKHKGYGILKDINCLDGKHILKIKKLYSDSPILLRQQLIKDYFLSKEPYFLKSTTQGRSVFLQQLPDSTKECFEESLLLEDSSYEWWDDLQNFIRDKNQSQNLDTGRQAEKKTIQFEKSRTNKTPKWKSLNNNSLGYDILSVENKNSSKVLTIEVKGSLDSIKNARFFISSGEWRFAQKSINHVFHLWSLELNALAIITKKDLINHIPINIGRGRWSSVELRFSEFEDKFQESNC